MSQQDSPCNRRSERVFTAVLVLFSAVALWQAWLIAGFSRLSSPGVFPMLAATVMVVSALFALRSKPAEPVLEQRDLNEPSLPPSIDSTPALPARVALMTGLLILYVLAMPLLGFLLDSGLFLFASFCYLWKKPVWISLITSLVALAVIHILFRLVFQVILPTGTFLDLFS